MFSICFTSLLFEIENYASKLVLFELDEKVDEVMSLKFVFIREITETTTGSVTLKLCKKLVSITISPQEQECQERRCI